jgi:hypothetical protein
VPLETSAPKERATVAVGEQPPQKNKGIWRKKKRTSRNALQAQPSEEKNVDMPSGYSGRTALRRDQCDSTPETIYKRWITLVTNYKQRIAAQRFGAILL